MFFKDLPLAPYCLINVLMTFAIIKHFSHSLFVDDINSFRTVSSATDLHLCKLTVILLAVAVLLAA
jgi:hypothetical protein